MVEGEGELRNEVATNNQRIKEMNNQRKQELSQLLNEAMGSLQMRPYGGDGSVVLPVNEYKRDLQKRWTFYSERPPIGSVEFLPYVTNEVAESRLLDFIRTEFGPFIHGNKILSACFAVLGGAPGGYPLERFLWQLLRISIVQGVAEAVLAFDRCTENTPGSFKVIALLEGMELDRKEQTFDGIQLVPLSDSPSRFPHYVPDLSDGAFARSVNSLKRKTLLIVDYSVFPMFYKPSRPTTEFVDKLRKEVFQTKIYSKDVSHSDAPNFFGQFCQALSLACNSPVQIALIWQFIAESELYNLYNRSTTGMSGRWVDTNPWQSSVKAGEAHIEKAKDLYKKLLKFKSGDRAKLEIAIHRWMKSKTPESPIDQIVDLGIAFEALYVPDGRSGEITFKLRVRAAWHLGKDKDDRSDLLAKFRDIYNSRSNAVHNGQLGRTVKFGGDNISASEFIKEVQDLCHQSTMKVLEKGKFPDWNGLIIGGEAED